MEPNIWGPGAWTFLHSITLNYPDNPTLEQKKIYSDFFNMLPKVLPCNICQEHLTKHFTDSPINFNLNSKESLTKWLVNIHNKSNEQYGKPTISYTEFLKIYDNMYKNKEESITYYKNKNSTQKKIMAVLVFTLFVFILLYFLQNVQIKNLLNFW